MWRLGIFGFIVGLTLALAGLPDQGVWRSIVCRAYYIPIFVIGTHSGMVAGLGAGFMASVICAAFAGAREVESMAWSIVPTLDFPVFGLLIGKFSRAWRQTNRLEAILAPAASDGLRPRYQSQVNLNPLASIQGAAGLLADDEVPVEVRQELAGIISAQCSQLAAELTPLICPGWVDKPAFHESDLNQIVDSVIRQAEFLLQDGNVKFRKDIAPDLPLIECNRDQIRDLLVTLIAAVVRPVRLAAEVMIAVQQSEGGILVTVGDHGRKSWLGIAGSHLAGLSERLRTDLTAALSVVRQHSGKISGRLNRTGRAFSIWLPLRQDQNDVARHIAAG